MAEVVRVEVAPALLEWAVKRAGWDAGEVRRRAPQLDRWINSGKLTLKQLQDFAERTHAPFGMFFLNSPPDETLPIPDMRTIANTPLGSPSGNLLDTIYLCQQRQDWYRDYVLTNELELPNFVGRYDIKTEPGKVARLVRKQWQFELHQRTQFRSWEEAFRYLIDKTEDKGILVMVSGIVGNNTHRRLTPEEFRGFALVDDVAPLVFINGSDTKAAQIFTLVHEIAHIFLGESALSEASMVTTGNTVEQWCNEVAAEVLVPVKDLRAKWTTSSDNRTEELERVAKLFRVSTLVVLKQLYAAGLLTWHNYQQWYDDEHKRILRIVRAKQGSGGGNYYYTQPLRASRRFSQAVIADTLEGSTSYREAYQLLGTRKHSTFVNLAEALGVA